MGLGTKLCCRHLSPRLAGGIPAQSLENLSVVGEKFRRVERIGERSGAGQEIKDRREGKRWVKVKRDLESGARMAHPTSRD